MFTLLNALDFPFVNNHVERTVRPAVIIPNREGDKSGSPIQCKLNDRGAGTQAILMSVYRTLEQRGHPPINTIDHALTQHLKTGHMIGTPPPPNDAIGADASDDPGATVAALLW